MSRVIWYLLGMTMMCKDWMSSVLHCDAGDDDCRICRFLNGDRSEENMLAVIRTLDRTLADREEHLGTITTAFAMIEEDDD